MKGDHTPAPMPPLWSPGFRLIHWASAALLGFALWMGLVAMGGFATMVWLPTHVTVGAGLLILLLARLIWRGFERRPAHRSRLPWIAARTVHVAIYVTFLAVMVTGWIAYRPMPLMPPVLVAGTVALPVFPFPSILPPLPYASLHRTLTWTLVALIVVHILAAGFHLVMRDGVFSAMTYRRRSQ